ncbi:hypothetical protein [Sphaerospermopsis sp. FACHB-1194]|uniref:hypothetical protein n=1 Tax=Sphaerospermopsis sp. FACHB-1194 TaxID=2692862 RepID=UPI00168180F6|nr:hypothetical protein [Sphaerospermopsis sp. FACHB-1194]MBD2146536.1 hypothetical protein [Sphaerospermopsis sp. FACHB-1194]
MNLQDLELAIAEATQKIEEIKAELLAAKQAKKELEKKQKTIKKNIDKAAKLIKQTSELSGTSQDDIIDAIKVELDNHIAEAANPVDNDSAITTADQAASDAHLTQATDSLKHLQPQNADITAHDTQLDFIKEELETRLTLLTLGERAIIAKNLNLKNSSDLYNYLADANKQEIDILVKELDGITPKITPKTTPNLPQKYIHPLAA